MSEFLNKLDQFNTSQTSNRWKGTFRQFLQLFESNEYPNLGHTSHQRVESMILHSGCAKQDYFGHKRTKYSFFEEKLFGIEFTIDQLMDYLHAAAKRTETAHKMLILYGPPGAGKSDLCTLIKRGLERYSRTKDGALFALSGSKMYENPFMLVPEDLRPEFEKNYHVRIEGQLSPYSRWYLDNELKGKFMEYPVEQIFISEPLRTCIGTWEPADEKMQDTSELVGSIDLAKIQEYGDESDPRSFSFTGELNVANRGVMEFIEGLKCLTADARIPTKDGLMRIADLHGHGRVPLLATEKFIVVNTGKSDGLCTCSCFKGIDECVQITTEKGYIVEGSTTHRILVSDNGHFKWVNLKDVQCGDVVVMSKRGIWTDKYPEIPIQMINNLSTNADPLRYADVRRKKLSISCMDEKLARLLGYFVAEGSYSAKNNRVNSIHISTDDQPIKEDIKNIARFLGLSACENEDGISIHSVTLCELFQWLGLKHPLSAELKHVPEIIYRSPKTVVASFLSAYFDGDGTVTDNDIGCCSASHGLIKGIQTLLLNFGIVSRQSKNFNSQYQKYYHYLFISSCYYDKFLSQIGFNLSRKQQIGLIRKENRIEHRDFIPSSLIFNQIWSKSKSYAQKHKISMAPKHGPIDGQEYVFSGRDIYTDVWRASKEVSVLSRKSVHKVIESISECNYLKDEVAELEEIIDDSIFYDTIREIVNTGKQEIFDLQESKTHHYSANGFIHHNSNEKFLRVLLTATQEHNIKAPRFGLISVDTTIIIHTNETEYEHFIREKKFEAYHDRMFPIRCTYNLGVKNEVRIYEKMLANADLHEVNIAPHTLTACAMFAVLSRLEPPKDGDLTIVKKMKLYDGQHVPGYKLENVLDIRKRSPREGMTGVSPRFVIDQINIAITKAIEEGRNFITPLDVMRQIKTAIGLRDVFKPEEKNRYSEYLDESRKEFNNLLKNDIQKAFFLSYDDEARNLCAKYLDMIDASLSGSKPRDPITQEEIELDEKLMDSIESHIDVSNSGKEDFRNEILRFFGMAARKGKTVDYTQHSQLREAIQKQLFAERQGVIRMTVSSHNPDPEALRRINEVVGRMSEQHGYTPESANELLKYATAHLFEK